MVYPSQGPTALQLFLLCFPLAPCPWPGMSLSLPCPQYPWWNRERWMATGGIIPALLPCSTGSPCDLGCPVLGGDGKGMRSRDWDGDEEEDEGHRWGVERG